MPFVHTPMPPPVKTGLPLSQLAKMIGMTTPDAGQLVNEIVSRFPGARIGATDPRQGGEPRLIVRRQGDNEKAVVFIQPRSWELSPMMGRLGDEDPGLHDWRNLGVEWFGPPPAVETPPTTTEEDRVAVAECGREIALLLERLA